MAAGAGASVVQTTADDLTITSPPKAKQPRVSRQLVAEELAAAAFAGVPPSGDNVSRESQLQWLSNFRGHNNEALQEGATLSEEAFSILWKTACCEHAELARQLERDAADTAASAAAAAAAADGAATEAAAAAAEAQEAALTGAPGASETEDAARLAASVAAIAAAADAAADVAAEVAARTGAAAAGALLPYESRFVMRKRLQVRNAWLEAHATSIESLEVRTPMLTPGEQHATRRLVAHATGPDGSALTFEDTVNYSLPPPEGDSSSAHRLRDDRHLQREREAILRLDERVEARISRLEVQEALQAQAAELKVEAAKIKARATRRIAKLKEERAELEKESRLAQQRRQGHLLQEQSSLLPQPEPPMQPQLQLKEAEEYEGQDLCEILRELNLGQFACPEFLDCMRHVGVSLDIACMSGFDAYGRLILYTCLCDFVNALNVHDAHEFLLHRELRKGR